MTLFIRNARLYDGKNLRRASLLLEDGVVRRIEENPAATGVLNGGDAEVLEGENLLVAPGFTDLHVHLRQPGFEHKETVATGTAAGAAGGFTTLCAMPNLNPVPHDLQALQPETRAIDKDARVRVLPYGALTVDEKGVCVADVEVLATYVAGFSDDGRGVQSEPLMLRAMERVAAVDGLVAAHCEVENLLPADGVTVQQGSVLAKTLGVEGVSNESESAEVKRDIRLAEATGCRFHVCHTSTAESFQLVRGAKNSGLRVTCEVTPHNLLLSCDDIPGDDGRFKMNPPLRTAADRDAALDALRDGTADAVATDHAPHAPEEKAGGFKQAMNGIVGLETAFPALYTGLVEPGSLPLTRLLEALTAGPRRVLGLEPNVITEGAKADLVVLDLAAERVVEPEKFLTKGRATPFEGWRLKGWPVLTVYNGEIVYRREE